ncbi:MAG: ATP-binding protein [Candidatus Eiseniibacteriota bacterium]
MSSLRAQLWWGASLVAVVPLALAMLVLAHQIRATLERDAARLLSAEMSEVRSQLADNDARMAARLRILGNDAPLKRLFLLRPSLGRDLADDLAERRFLLGLDVLAVADSGGAVVAADSAEGGGLALRERAPIRYQGETTGWVIGGVRVDAAYLSRLSRGGALELAIDGANGVSGAATLDSAGAAAALANAPLDGERPVRVRLASGTYLARGTSVALGEAGTARLVGLVSAASADRMVATLQITSLLLALLGLVVAALLAALLSSQVSRPVEQIAAFSSRLAEGQWDDPLLVHGVREMHTLVDALDRMRDDLRRYRSRLVTSERQAAWGQMARQVAHEVKNPLTPIAISVADLKRSYEQQRPDFPAVLDQATRTVAAEIESLKRMLQEFSDFGRMSPPQLSRIRVRDLLVELNSLYARDIAERRLVITPPGGELACTADAAQLRQALVNLIKNGLEAIRPGGRVELGARADLGTLEFTVSDDGPGLSDEQRARLFVPGFSTKAEGAGLGLTIVERIVSDHGGTVQAEAAGGGGTLFRVRIPLESGS